MTTAATGLASPLDFSKVPRLPAAPAPLLGQHTDEILQDVLGLSAAEVGSLHDAFLYAFFSKVGGGVLK